MIGKLITGSVEGVGNAVSDVVGTIWGSKRERESAVHNEQMGVLAHFAPDFVGRPLGETASSTGSTPAAPTDHLRRYSPGQLSRRVTFVETMQTLAVVPDELWIMMLTIIAFWFGDRFIKRDLGKPWVSKQQLELAREIVARRTGEAEGSMSAVKETRALPPVPVYRPADDPLSRRRSLRCRLIGANSPPTWP